MKKQNKKNKQTKETPLLKLDIGCGKNKKPDFYGVDAIKFEGVDLVYDIRKTPWPWKDNSVEEIHTSHFVEHLTSDERCKFANEAYRILKPDGKVTIVVPHYASGRAYGDPTHMWPPVSEMWFYYLGKEWRDKEAPHTNKLFTCNFESTWGYGLHPMLVTRNQEFQQFALNFYREAVQDIHATLIAKK